MSKLATQVKPHQGQIENFIGESARFGTVDLGWTRKLFGVELLGVFPEVFEGIVFALLPGKEVNHEVDGIENEPTTGLKPVTGINVNFIFLEGFLEGIPQGLEVWIRGAGGDDETVGQG